MKKKWGSDSRWGFWYERTFGKYRFKTWNDFTTYLIYWTHCQPIQLLLCSKFLHYNDVIMGTMAPQITCLTIACSIVYSGGDRRKHQSSASLAFVWGINRWPVNSPHKWPVTRKRFPFNDVIMFAILHAYIRCTQTFSHQTPMGTLKV